MEKFDFTSRKKWEVIGELELLTYDYSKAKENLEEDLYINIDGR